MFPWRHQGRLYSLLPSGSLRHSLACGCTSPMLCLHVVLSLCASVFIWPSSYKDTDHSGLGTHLTPTWPLNYICNTISKSSHMRGVWTAAHLCWGVGRYSSTHDKLPGVVSGSPLTVALLGRCTFPDQLSTSGKRPYQICSAIRSPNTILFLSSFTGIVSQ